MAEHAELVAEITSIEKMTTQERLKHAKKRRNTQLKKYSQYEKQLEKEQSKKKKSNKKVKKTNNNIRRVMFVNNIMLLEAAARNDIEEVRELLSKGVSPDVTNEDGLTALHQCCIDDLEDMMKLLIQFRANVNARDSELWTPLHAAATCGHVHLCNYLINNGAELLAVNADGNMPYDICEDEVTLDFIENEMAKRGVTQELIDETRLSTEKKMLEDLKMAASNKEDLDFTGRQGETPLHIAAANGYYQVAEYLLEQRVRVDPVDGDSWQPVHCAACWGHLPVLEVLVQYGADLDARTKNGETPFDICEDPDIRDRILEMRTEIETNKRTRTQKLVRRRSTNTRSRDVLQGTHHQYNSTGSLYSSNTSLSERRKSRDSGDGSALFESSVLKQASSASVRRTSMREKGAMSLKEAKEERERLRESASSADEEGIEEADKQNGDDTPPTTNIDDIRVTVKDSAPTEVKEESPPASPQVPDQPSPKTTVKERDSNLLNGPSIPKPPSRTSLQQEDMEQTKPPPPAPAENRTTPVAKKSVAPPPPLQVPKPAENSVNESSGADEIADDNSSKSSPAAGQQTQPSYPPSAATTPPGGGFVNPANPQPGTLADLKKKRAQELRDSLRFKEAQMIKQQIQNYNLNHNNPTQNASTVNGGGGGSSGTTSPQSNGQNGAVSSRRGSDASYYGGVDPPKHKFTASTQEIVGGNDNKTGCCVVQ